MIKPSRILIMLLYIGMMSGIVMLMSPEEIIVIEDLTLRIPTWEGTFFNKQETADITNIIALEEKVDNLEEKIETTEVDTVANKEVKKTPTKKEKKAVEKSETPIELSPSNPNALDYFFNSLTELSDSNSLVRILHYGDSQLEGDRISEYLRNRLQNQFGGCGVGLVPFTELQNMRSTLLQDASEHWKKYAAYDYHKLDSTYTGNYGLMAKYHLFDPPKEDSAASKEEDPRAWLFFEKAKTSYKRNNRVEQMTLIYGKAPEPIEFEYEINGRDTIFEDFLPIEPVIGLKTFPLPFEEEEKLEQMNLSFLLNDFKESPEFYGLTFDCETGIAFDNIALRGSSGVEFTKMNRKIFKTQLEELNTKLIILQFGVNVVPGMLLDYTYYKNRLYQQLRFIKSAIPDISIIVIGVSDMSRKRGTTYETYPNISLVRDAQKNAAFKAGCAYWDLFTAMGGENSMISWVEADPPLAAADYTHFTRRGAKLVGELFYAELMRSYDEFLNKELE